MPLVSYIIMMAIALPKGESTLAGGFVRPTSPAAIGLIIDRVLDFTLCRSSGFPRRDLLDQLC
jgi:hypothetical protein